MNSSKLNAKTIKAKAKLIRDYLDAVDAVEATNTDTYGVVKLCMNQVIIDDSEEEDDVIPVTTINTEENPEEKVEPPKPPPPSTPHPDETEKQKQ